MSGKDAPSPEKGPAVPLPASTAARSNLGLSFFRNLGRGRTSSSSSVSSHGPAGTAGTASSSGGSYSGHHGKQETASDKLTSLLAAKPGAGGHSATHSHYASSSTSGTPSHHTSSDQRNAHHRKVSTSRKVGRSSTALRIAEVFVRSSDILEQQALGKQLVNSLHINAQAEPLEVWLKCRDLLNPARPPGACALGIEILKACVAVSTEETGELGYGYERQTYYEAVKTYFERKEGMKEAEMQSLVAVLEVLTRGGRNVFGFEQMPKLLMEMALAIFSIRQRGRLQYTADLQNSSVPLLDPTFATPFVRLPPGVFLLSVDPKFSPVALLIATLRFSFPHLREEEVSHILGTVVKRAMGSLGEHEVERVLEVIDTIVKFGYIPTGLLEDVVHLVVRTAGLEGRCHVLDVSPDGQQRDAELAEDLMQRAHSVMRNLLRSPTVQALKQLRSILSIPMTPGKTCPTPLLVGAIKCLRRAFKEFETMASQNDRPNEYYPSLMTMGMVFLHDDLLVATQWKSEAVDSEILLFLDERFAAKAASKAQLTHEEWDMVFTLMAKMTWHIAAREGKTGKAWSIDMGANLGNARKLPVAAGSKSDAAPAKVTVNIATNADNPNANIGSAVDVLDAYSLILRSMMAAQNAGPFIGSHLRYYGFLLHIAQHLTSSSVLSIFHFYQSRNLVFPGIGDWIERLKSMISTFFPLDPEAFQRETTRTARRMTVQLLKDAYGGSQGHIDHVVLLLEEVLLPFCGRVLHQEKDPQIVSGLLQLLEANIRDMLAIQEECLPLRKAMDHILDLLRKLTWQHPAKDFEEMHAAFTGNGDRGLTSPAVPVDISMSAMQTLISLFYHSIISSDAQSAFLGVRIYRHMISILSPTPVQEKHSTLAPTRTRFAVLQCLVRLRADRRHRVWSRHSLEFEELAASIGRVEVHESDHGADLPLTAETGSRTVDRGRKAARREHLSGSGSAEPSPASGHPGSKASSRSRTRNEVESPNRSRIRSNPPHQPLPLWTFPDTLTFAFPGVSCHSVGMYGLVSFDHARMNDWEEGTAAPQEDSPFPTTSDGLVVLPVSEYLKVLIDCLEHETNWDIVSYLLCAVPNQIANKHFAAGPRASRQIQVLRHFLCERLDRDTLCSQVDIPPSIRRSDVHTIAYQWLATLVAYRGLFTKEQQNEMVSTFMRGLSKTPNIAKPCVHALTMACYEFESAMSKYLPEILEALVRIMTTVNMPVHILELVASIGHIRSLYANFTEDDFRKVFALAIQYLSAHYERLLEDPSSVVVPEELKEALVHAFKQYVFLLSFYVITLWYTVVPTSERPKYTSFIVQRLRRANEGLPRIDPATEVSLDMLTRLAYTESTPFTHDVKRRSHEKLVTKTWIIANSIISVDGTQGVKSMEVAIKRPSGVIKAVLPLDASQNDIPILECLLQHRYKFQINPKLQLDYPSSKEPALFEADPAFFSLLLPPHTHINNVGLPREVPNADAFRRSLTVLDSMPHIDFHSIGVIYVAAGQKNEREILANIHGSKAYTSFLTGLGPLIRLKDCDAYTGGLDRENDFDGKFAYMSSDDIQQIIFHVATLMPTRLEQDPGCNYKKRHIGNDYVKIIYNDSGVKTPFDIIPGQFNFINIIVEPHTPAGSVWRGAAGVSNSEFFRISLQRRPDMPEIGPLGLFKMVSTESLSDVVRELALHANLFAQLFLQSVGVEGRSANRQKLEYTSTWRNRLHAIQTLSERVDAEARSRQQEPQEPIEQ